MVENEGGRTHRRLAIRSTSSKPWPAPDGSTSSHNVERRLYKLLQPRRFLRSDNGVSEPDSSLDATDLNAQHRIPSSTRGSNKRAHIFEGLDGGPKPRDLMHGCVGAARPWAPRFPGSQFRRLWSPGTSERAAVKPPLRRWCLCLHRWRCLGPKICRTNLGMVDRLAGMGPPARVALAQPLQCGCQQRASFFGDLWAWPWPCLATSALPRYQN